MKKVLFSLASAIVLLSSCGSEENVPVSTKTGDLHAQVIFDNITAKAALSTAIPVTNWDNVKKIQLFLYDTTSGAVAFSSIIDPSTATDKIFKWTNVPQGTYDLALVANINSATTGGDNVATSLDGGTSWTKFDAYNVLTKALNTDLFIDLKKSTFPAGHTFTGKTAFAPASEIFTAYASTVKIEEGKTTDLSGAANALKLKREISLMRIRIDKTDKVDAPALSSVDFANANNFLAVENMPIGLGVKVGTFAGGIYPTASDADRVMIASEGVNTYNTADPATGYLPKEIIDAQFTLWKDIQILPNATRAEAKAPSADADAARRYFVVLSGWAPVGYVYADGTEAKVAQPVYWAGSVKGVFSPNIIREVNMTIKSKGYPEIPNPEKEGTLIIEVGSPENWNSNIETEELDV
ncbi:MAG: FimB/Mfa2 family fimbrial subunit [Dysgonomonas sp.]